MTQTTLNGKQPIVDWFETRHDEYSLTSRRLFNTKLKFLTADTKDAVRMLDMSYSNAVISQQCSVEKHEAGWVHWCQTGDIPEYVVYSNQKTDWLKATNVLHKYNVVRMLQSDASRQGIDKAHRYLHDNFVGLGLMKAAFTLAMLGFTSRMCIDTNVAQVTGIETRGLKKFDSYIDACDEVCQEYDMGLPPFITQWVLFDFNRGNHSTHEVWFRQMGTWVDNSSGLWRDKF